MASLTQISISARKVIRYGIYLIILLVILRFAFNISLNLYRRVFPPREPAPTVAFGKLPKLALPDKPKAENINYTLELVGGDLPKLPEQTLVYEMPAFQSDIKVIDDAKRKANQLGFNPDGKVLVESIPNVYVFKKGATPATLTMNVITGIFSISYNINENPNIFEGTPGQPETSVDFVRNYLKGFLSEDLTSGPGTTELLRYEGGKFVPAVSISESNAIKVNIFRKGFGKDGSIPSVTPDMPEANVWFILAGRSRTPIAAEYHSFPINTSKIATYPLKTSEKAWEELKEGKAYFANIGENSSGVIIRKIYLAYYDAGQYAQYYQPVIVFEGDNKFFAFVPAVIDEHYGREQATTTAQ